MVGPEGTKRISKIDTYLNVAEAFAYRSTCIKRKYGAVIVKDDVVPTSTLPASIPVIILFTAQNPAPSAPALLSRPESKTSTSV